MSTKRVKKDDRIGCFPIYAYILISDYAAICRYSKRVVHKSAKGYYVESGDKRVYVRDILFNPPACYDDNTIATQIEEVIKSENPGESIFVLDPPPQFKTVLRGGTKEYDDATDLWPNHHDHKWSARDKLYGIIVRSVRYKTVCFAPVLDKVIQGWKMLSPDNATYGRSPEGRENSRNPMEATTSYPVPDGSGWGPWYDHPNPAKMYDGRECGEGGWHIMTTPSFDALYAPKSWWPWRAEIKGIIGTGADKARGTSIRLKRINYLEFISVLQSGLCEGSDLSGIRLYGDQSNLDGLKLRGVRLQDAVFQDCTIVNSDFTRANLNDAIFESVGFVNCNLTDAMISSACFHNCTFRNCKLVGLDFRSVLARNVVFASCDLRMAKIEDEGIYSIWNSDLRGAICGHEFIKGYGNITGNCPVDAYLLNKFSDSYPRDQSWEYTVGDHVDKFSVDYYHTQNGLGWHDLPSRATVAFHYHARPDDWGLPARPINPIV